MFFPNMRDQITCPRDKLTGPYILTLYNNQTLHSTFDDTGVGLSITLPNSLSSRASIPGFSVYSFTLTAGSGCVVEKSP
jgi:hypothetical protein